MNNALIAEAKITINTSAAKVWDAITNPEIIKQYLFGAEVISDWKAGSPIIYKGIYQGKAYEDKGTVLKAEPEKLLLITHWSPLSGTANSPENYHKVSYEIMPQNGRIRLTISQDNNATIEEQGQNAQFWQAALDSIKKLLEN